MPQLSISLTEPTIFLRRSSDVTATGRRRQVSADTPPAVLRGVLTLKLSTPMKVKDIQVFLEGKSVTEWPEGLGPRHNQFEETTPILHASATVFRARDRSSEAPRRTKSVGPGILAGASDGESDDEEGRGGRRGRTRHSITGQRSGGGPSNSRSKTPERGIGGLGTMRGVSADRWGRTGYPITMVEHSAELFNVPSPAYTPEPALHEIPQDAEPGHALETLRNALKAHTHHFIPVPGQATDSRPSTSKSRSRPSSAQRPSASEHLQPLSRGPSRILEAPIEEGEATPTGLGSPIMSSRPSTSRRPSTVGSSSGARPSLFPQLSSDHEPKPHTTGDTSKKQKRFSLTAAWHDMKEIVRPKDVGTPTPSARRTSFTADKENVRQSPGPSLRPPIKPPATAGGGSIRSAGPSGPADRSRDTSRGRDRTVVGKLGDALNVLGLDEGNSETSEEFRKGTFNWPVSFTIPADSPPTLRCNYGYVMYRLKAHVNRPGAFHGKLIASADVTVIICPGEDDTEETESIVVEREWEDRMRYIIALSGKTFPIGGTMPLHLTLISVSKMNLHRFTVAVEEKVSYYAHGRHESRQEPLNVQQMIALRHSDKQTPLLPITSSSPNAASSSPLAPFVEAEDPSDVAEHLLSSGPWDFHFMLKVPDCSTNMHFTNKTSKTKIEVNHTLKIMMRVDRGDDALDAKGKRKQFDIIVECPITLLSCRCNPDWINLPTYSVFSIDGPQESHGCICGASRQESPPPIDGSSRTRNHELLFPLGAGGLPLSPIQPQGNSHAPPDPDIAERNQQFARLVAGTEGPAGEMPPSYEEAALEADL